MAASAAGALLILRRACSSATQTASKPAGAGKTRRKKSLVEVASLLPNGGVGAKLAKGHWQPNTFYQLTRLQLNKDSKHGAAWGVFHDSGTPKTGTEEKIGGVHKRVWRYLKGEDQSLKKL